MYQLFACTVSRYGKNPEVWKSDFRGKKNRVPKLYIFKSSTDVAAATGPLIA